MLRKASIIIVGSGAAGLMAGIFAARAGADVLVLETRRQPGAKIRVSGGGRCNVLPSRVSLADYHTAGSTKALRNILMSWPLADVQRFFHQDLAIPLKTEATGKVFPVSDRSKDVVDALLTALERSGARLATNQRIVDVRRDRNNHFVLRSAADDELRAERVILATGGLSMPKTGSDGAGWRFARGLGHRIVSTYPALVPLCGGDPTLASLAGVSLPTALSVEHRGRNVGAHAGDFLFTHHGYSGPAVLNASRHVTAPDGADTALRVAWGGLTREGWEDALRSGGRGLVASVVRERLPRRLADVLLERAGIDSAQKLGDLTRQARSRLVEQLGSFLLHVSGNEGYRTAEVTAGGIPLEEVHTKTLESRCMPGLHLAGEMLDVTGRLGGYNFLWAWVSGRRAGEGACHALSAERCEPSGVTAGDDGGVGRNTSQRDAPSIA